MKIHGDSCWDNRTGISPMAILQQTDATLDPVSSEVRQIVLINKDDPCAGRSLMPRSQVIPGEVVTLDVSWADTPDAGDEDTHVTIFFFAQYSKVENLEVHNGLLVSLNAPDDNRYVIARVKVPKPPEFAPPHIYVASWPNPSGRTIATTWYIFKDGEDDAINMLATSHEILRQKAAVFAEEVHGLDTYSISKTRSMSRWIEVTSAEPNSDAVLSEPRVENTVTTEE
jgi:hypothetical protein